MWYTIYRKSDGALLGHTQLEPNVDLTKAVLETPDRQDQGQIWDEQTRSWIPRPVSRRVVIGHLFKALAPQELKALAESQGTGATAFFRALKLLEGMEEKIDKDSAIAAQLLQWLVDDGVLTTQRKNQLLN